jgi:hypothetical protein
MSGFGLPGGPRPAGPWHTTFDAAPANAGYGAAPALPAGWGDVGPMIARPTPDQLNAGGHMSAGGPILTDPTAPPPGQRPVPVPGATPGYGPPQSAGAPGGFGAANLAYSQDPATWALNYARAHGHVPGQGHTQMGDFLQKLWTNMATAIFGLSPDLATLDPTAAMNNILYGGANTMYGNAANFADQAFGGLQGKMGQMDESKQWELMNAYDALKTMGRNKYWQNARENQLSGALEQYKNKQQQLTATTGAEPPADLWSFIMGQPGVADYGR